MIQQNKANSKITFTIRVFRDKDCLPDLANLKKNFAKIFKQFQTIFKIQNYHVIYIIKRCLE